MYQPCTAYFQKSETTWNNKTSRLDVFPSLTFGCSFPLQEKNKRKLVYTIYVAPKSTKQTIKNKTAKKIHRHLSPGKLAKILDSSVKVSNLSWTLRPKNDPIFAAVVQGAALLLGVRQWPLPGDPVEHEPPVDRWGRGQFKGLVTTWVSGICGVG